MSDRSLEHIANELEGLLPRVMWALFRSDDDPLKDRPLSQVRLLRALYSGSKPFGELRSLLHVSASSLSQISSRLIRAGLIEKSNDDGDKRTKLLKLTERGYQLMSKRQVSRAQHAVPLITSLTPDQLNQLLDILRRLSSKSSMESDVVELKSLIVAG